MLRVLRPLRRCFATAAPSDIPKPKPKETTPLRRSASASLPFRSTRTPTRSEIQTVFTLATAERYLLSRLQEVPNLPPSSRILHESWWLPKWGPANREGEVFVFKNGSFVCWGLQEADARRFAAEVIGRASNIEVGPLKEPETEELEFVTDSEESVFLVVPNVLLIATLGTPGCRVI